MNDMEGEMNAVTLVLIDLFIAILFTEYDVAEHRAVDAPFLLFFLVKLLANYFKLIITNERKIIVH